MVVIPDPSAECPRCKSNSLENAWQYEWNKETYGLSADHIAMPRIEREFDEKYRRFMTRNHIRCTNCDYLFENNG